MMKKGFLFFRDTDKFGYMKKYKISGGFAL
jgi:hypothetical protein